MQTEDRARVGGEVIAFEPQAGTEDEIIAFVIVCAESKAGDLFLR